MKPIIIPDFIRRTLLRVALWYSRRRPPDNPIGGDYLHRWYITPWSGAYRDDDQLPAGKRWWQRIVTSLPGIYLHIFYRSDYDRALHDHPWDSVSVVLSGGYFEHTPPRGSQWRPPGSVIVRRAEDLHRVQLPSEFACAVTLFITGRRRRQWGFDCEEGWRSYPEWMGRGGCD